MTEVIVVSWVVPSQHVRRDKRYRELLVVTISLPVVSSHGRSLGKLFTLGCGVCFFSDWICGCVMYW